MSNEFGIIDLFAGPGGLGEGFSVAGREASTRMSIELSIEKEATEVETLRLRSFLRSFEEGFPEEYYSALQNGTPTKELPGLLAQAYPDRWEKAIKEARRMELGQPGVFEEIAEILDNARERYNGNTLLIGGPPCQAYSLVGRSRNRGKADYNAAADHRHWLFREYVRILDRLRPAAFVMENVQGILSSTVDGLEIFKHIREDLQAAGDGYTLLPLAADRLTDETDPKDFRILASDFGVPQARHRVIILGIRKDIKVPTGTHSLMERTLPPATVHSVLSGLPALRSGITRQKDNARNWHEAVHHQAHLILTGKNVDDELRTAARSLAKGNLATFENRTSRHRSNDEPALSGPLADWLRDDRLGITIQHETRGHMASDLGRYLFCALFAQIYGRSPKLPDFPNFLLPNHRNVASGKFVDRFHVQRWEPPSRTVTSHIKKDGHAFIHPDPAQVRSLTVREAARLQSFPDNYLFMGSRGDQFHQVGNAVPPFLALQIARVVRDIVSR